MRRHRRNSMRGLALITAAVLMIGAVVAVDNRLRPLVQSYGYMAARRAAMLAVHTGVEAVLADEVLGYTDLVTVERNSEGHILSAEANVNAINRLKAAATNAVMAELSAREVQTASIPLGNLVGGSFFTGRGPFLSVKIHSSGVVISNLSSEFGDAGINQTNHRISLDMTVMMTAALPMERVSIELKTAFLVCETVLVGEVPQTVLQLELGDAMRNIFGSND
ncbi:MAG: sporulation protein YunB [Clostridia bacterium]|nr:sporulation protein YunB [Clostridia bacterium]